MGNFRINLPFPRLKDQHSTLNSRDNKHIVLQFYLFEENDYDEDFINLAKDYIYIMYSYTSVYSEDL